MRIETLPYRASKDIRVADEVFFAVAWLHRSQPLREDFSVEEIADAGRHLQLTKDLRPGFAVHVSQHCVANKPPQPCTYRMLFETARGRRRLLLPEDEVHPGRTGKIMPRADQIPAECADLLDWARERYESARTDAPSAMGLEDLRGSGKGLWPEGGDAFVDSIRSGW